MRSKKIRLSSRIHRLTSNQMNQNLKKKQAKEAKKIESRSAMRLRRSGSTDSKRIHQMRCTMQLEKGDLDDVRFLLRQSKTVDDKTEHQETALTAAATFGHAHIVDELIINYGAAIEEKDWFGNTALAHAAMGNHLEIVRLLVRHGAVVDRVCREGATALSWAAMFGHVDVVHELIKSGAVVIAENEYGRSPLSVALKVTTYLQSKN